jgi:hypothetical protein
MKRDESSISEKEQQATRGCRMVISGLATTLPNSAYAQSRQHVLRLIRAILGHRITETQWSRICQMAESPTQTRRTLWQLLFIAVLLGIGYACTRTLSFRVEAFNFLFVCAFFLMPFLAIRPVLRLQQRARYWGFLLLTPLLLCSSCSLLFTVACEGPGWSSTRTEPLQTFQLDNSTVQLERYENGGAVGVHGLNLEQRRLIAPGLFVVRSVDFFDSAHEGTLSVEGPYRVRVHAKGNYYSNDYEVDKVYSLKPWVYF